MDSDTASAVPEFSGGCRAGSGGQAHRGDITGAALDPELVASARSGEILSLIHISEPTRLALI
eukprot:9582602-Alexandrium_andersonii.AAC.1